MSWNLQLSWEEFGAEWETKSRKADEIINNKMRKYFEIFEAGSLEKLFEQVELADKKHTPSENYRGIIDAMEIYLMQLEEARKRICRHIDANDIKKIHILKSQINMPEKDYRELIFRISGQVSSKDLAYWEAKIMIRALEKRKERS